MVGIYVAVQVSPEEEVVAKEPTPIVPIVPKRHRWRYRVLVVLIWFIVILGSVWLGYTSYMYAHAWYDTAISKAYAGGKADGLARGLVQGKQQGAFVQQRIDDKILLQVKTHDAQDLQKDKLAAYKAGEQVAVDTLHTWWLHHCSYDSVIAKYVCNNSP